MDKNQDIDQLLNGFIDGQLSPRQQTQLQRLLKHEPEIAKRLDELKKCKMLVSSLPPAQPPQQMLGNIMASLETPALSSTHLPVLEHHSGARQLFMRKLVAAAAMIALVAVLTAVIYTIVGPQAAPKKVIVSDNWTQPGRVQTESEKPSPAIAAQTHISPPTLLPLTEFNARLEFKTDDLVAADAFIKRTIADNNLSEYPGLTKHPHKSVYILSSSPQALSSVLADLENIWDRFDSPVLYIETDSHGTEIAVDAINPQQIVEIANKNTLRDRIKLAKDFAFLNEITQPLPGERIFAAVENKKPRLLNIPKPVLTSTHKTGKIPTLQTEDRQKIHLTIVVEAGK